jgi:Lrp/AsnC family transcriptional regulator, leucine-responsive regulatory protein
MVLADTSLKTKTLDKLSQRILKELCNDARVSNAEIGRRVGLSSPAVAERIQKMEEQGIVRGHHTVVDFDKLGLSIRALINFKSLSLKHDDMLNMIENMPEIVEWHTITGTPCMVLKVVTNSSKELEAVIVHLGKFGETSTSLILSEGSSKKFYEKILG